MCAQLLTHSRLVLRCQQASRLTQLVTRPSGRLISALKGRLTSEREMSYEETEQLADEYLNLKQHIPAGSNDYDEWMKLLRKFEAGAVGVWADFAFLIL